MSVTGAGRSHVTETATMAAMVTVVTDRFMRRRNHVPIAADSIEGATRRRGSTVGQAIRGPTAAISGVLTTAATATIAVIEEDGTTGVATALPRQPRQHPSRRRRASSLPAPSPVSGRRTPSLWPLPS